MMKYYNKGESVYIYDQGFLIPVVIRKGCHSSPIKSWKNGLELLNKWIILMKDMINTLMSDNEFLYLTKPVEITL